MEARITFSVNFRRSGRESLLQSPGPSNLTIVTRESLFDKMQRTNLPTFEEKFDKIAEDLLSSDFYSHKQIKDLKCQLAYLKSEFKRRWQKAGRHPDRFAIQNHTWLKGILTIPVASRRHTRDESEQNVLKILAMFVEADLSEQQYEIIRSANKNLYPKYSVLEKAKLDSYPSKGSYRLKETCSEIKLQNLLNVTAARLMACLDKVLKDFDVEEECDSFDYDMICQWGFVENQPLFGQKLQEQGFTDSRIFLTYFVPIHLTCGSKMIWHNPETDSERYCRPIRLRFVTGKTYFTEDEITYIEYVISELKPFKYSREFVTYNINFKLMLNTEDDNVNKAAITTKSSIKRYMKTIENELISQGIFSNDMHMEKLLNQMVLRSDPLLTSLRPKLNKGHTRPLQSKFEECDFESSENSSVLEENTDDSDEESRSSVSESFSNNV